MKQALIYSLKVWLTIIFLAPLLCVLLQLSFNTGFFPDLKGAFYFVLLTIPAGLLLSIPCWLLLFITAWLVKLFCTNATTMMVILTAVGVVLAVLPFYLIFDSRDRTLESMYLWAGAYFIVTVSAIWLHRLQDEDAVDVLAEQQ